LLLLLLTALPLLLPALLLLLPFALPGLLLLPKPLIRPMLLPLRRNACVLTLLLLLPLTPLLLVLSTLVVMLRPLPLLLDCWMCGSTQRGHVQFGCCTDAEAGCMGTSCNGTRQFKTITAATEAAGRE
jgi:hypothetical protein